MKIRFLAALPLVALSFAVSADELHLAPYGVAKTFDFRIFAADGTYVTNATDGGTDVTLTCNDGTPATATNDFADEGSHYSIALTATELQCARLVVDVADATPNGFIVETYGHASAQHTTLGWLTGDAYARLGAPVGASISADLQVIDQNVDDVETDTGTAGVLVSSGTGSGQISITSGVVSANMAQISTDSAAADRLEAMLDGTCGSYPELGITRGVGCTAQAYTAGTPSITLDTSAAFGDNTLAGATILICGSTQGYCQPAIAASNVGSTDIVTLRAALPVAATGTITYTIFGTGTGSSDVNVTTVEGSDATTYFGTLDDAVVGLIGTPTNLGSGATLAANTVDIESQTDDIGTAGAGLTAADDAVMTRLGAPAGASVSADIAATKSDTAAILVDTGTTLDDLVDDLETRLTATRAGYLDNLSAGAVATASALATADGNIDTILVTTDKLDDTLELDSTVYRFTVNALEQAPVGGGGGATDWTADERTAIRAILGVPGSGTTPADPSAGILDAIRDGQSTLATSSALSSLVADIGANGAGLAALPWNSAWDAEVQSEVEDALDGETCTEPSAKPSWGTSTVKEWVCWIGAWSRNKVTQTGSGDSGTKTLRNDADNANLVTCSTADDGSTFTLSECTP